MFLQEDAGERLEVCWPGGEPRVGQIKAAGTEIEVFSKEAILNVVF